ncbi:MAG: hypothetical protein JNL29_04980 [Nitrospira sp.]|nr:hypothetical protein [Nitrospira sp.]
MTEETAHSTDDVLHGLSRQSPLQAADGERLHLFPRNLLKILPFKDWVDVAIEDLSVVVVCGVFAGLFDSLKKGFSVGLKCDAGLWTVEGHLSESKAGLDLLRDLLGRLLARISGANPLGLAGALMVDKDPPGPFPLSNLHAHKAHLA